METQVAPPGESEKRILPALVLWFFLGVLGAHQFYAGNIGRGVAYLVCLGVAWWTRGAPGDAELVGTVAWLFLAVGLVADLIRLCIGNFPDGRKRPLKRWT